MSIITKSASLLFASVFLLLTIAKAQVTTASDRPKLLLGAAGGASFNRFASGQPHTGYNVGASGGFLANYNIAKHISLQLEANFLQQGGQLLLFRDDTKNGLPESIDTKNVTNSSYLLNSIEIPLSVHYTFPINQTWQPSIYVGGNYAYTLSVTEKYQKTGNLLPGEDVIATVSGSRAVKGSFNSVRLGLLAGANVMLPINSNLKLLLDMRYLHGVAPARENYSYMNKIGFGSTIRTNALVSRIGIIVPIQ